MSIELKKKLRANSTAAERAFWRLIHPFRTGVFHFRKQVQLGSYYVDFACLHAQLVVEVDGDTHGNETALANDRTRDLYLNERGFRVLRFTNEDVLTNAEGVFRMVDEALQQIERRERGVPPPQPSPQGGGCSSEHLAGVRP